MTNLSLDNFEENLQKRINSLLNSYLNSNSQIENAIKFSLSAPGKRVRPILIYLVGDIYDISLEKLDSLALASEIIHTYSLVHDDLPCMDDDDLRRGKPTCHVQFDEATAVLAGDALLTLAFEILSDKDTHADPMARVRLVSLFAQSAGAQGMIGGQMMDILAEQRDKEVDYDQGALARLQRKKTGALFSACCEAGLILNGGTNEEYHRFTSYAKNIGLAFQMVDDILDVIGNEEDMGKATQKDDDAGKVTFAQLLGVDGARRQAEFLCGQAADYLRPFGDKAHMMRLLAKFVVARSN